MSRVKNYLRKKLSIEKTEILKFSVSKANMCALSIVAVLTLLAYFTLSYYESNLSLAVMSDSSLANDYRTKISLFQAFKNILIVLTSIVSTSIISFFLVDIKSKNHTVSDLLVNDVFASQDFYDTLSPDNRTQLMQNLEKNLYFNNSSTAESMYKSMKDSINDFSTKPYYEKCSFDIRCSINENYIEKSVIKSFRLKTFKDRDSISKFPLVTCSYKPSPSVKNPIILNKVYVDGKAISIDKDTGFDDSQSPSDITKKCGYTYRRTYYLNKKLTLWHKSYIDIKIEYTTQVELQDITYTCRMHYPCKYFNLSFHIKPDHYKLVPFAFGFVDDGDKSPNRSNDFTETHIEFNDWVFPYDGVAIVICKNK